MTVNQRIINALSAFGIPVVPELYTGSGGRYFTFNYDLIPVQFAGNRPTYWKALVQVHSFCPLHENSIRRRRETVAALTGAGFTWPEIVDASEKDHQHFVFECEIIIGEDETNA